MTMGDNGQVFPVPDRVDIGFLGRKAQTIFLGDLVIAKAFLRGAIKICIPRKAALFCCVCKLVQYRIGRPDIRNVQRAASAVIIC